MPRYAGYTAWRMIVPAPPAATESFETWGPGGSRFAVLPLSDGACYCYAKDRWRSFWAEVPLLTGPGRARPSFLKVDQIVFLGGRNCCLVELKVTTRSYHDILKKHQMACAERFRACQDLLSSRGFDVVDSRLLIAHALGERPPVWESIEL